MIKLAIFDMDGTICDSIADLTEATNRALEKLGCPLHTKEEYVTFVGNGIPMLVYRALPENRRSEAEHAEATRLMLEYYNEHFCDMTESYDGISELLDILKERGIPTAVCTNKAQEPAEHIVNKLFKGKFDLVVGKAEGRPLKPDAFSTALIMKHFGVSPEETLFIGDSEVDMQTAVNSGANAVGVLWGYRDINTLKENGAEHIAATPMDIPRIIEKI